MVRIYISRWPIMTKGDVPTDKYIRFSSVCLFLFVFYFEELAWEGAWPGAIALKLTNGGLSCESNQSTTKRGERLSKSPSSTAKQHGRGACFPLSAGVGCRCDSWARRPIVNKFTMVPANGSGRAHFGSKQAASANASRAQNGRTQLSVTFGAAYMEELTKRTNRSASYRVG